MNATRPLYIVGAGGMGRETVVLAERLSDAAPPQWRLAGFVDDDADLHDREVLGYPVVGDVDGLARDRDAACVVAVGAPDVRRRLTERLHTSSRRFPTLVDPTLFLHASVSVGAGSLLYRGAVVMTAVQIGRSAIVDANATVGHDAVLGDYVTLHPGAHVSGHVTLGDGVTLGAGSVVLPGLSIGRGTTVGAGAVVTRDLPADCTAVGVPARPVASSH